MRILIYLIIFTTSINLFSNDLKENSIRINLQYCNDNLVQLEKILIESYALTKEWVFDKGEMTKPSKNRLKTIHDSDTLIKIYSQLLRFKDYFSNETVEALIRLSSSIETMIFDEKYVMERLSHPSYYDDPFLMFSTQPKVESGGSLPHALDNAKIDIDILRIYCNYLLDKKRIKPTIVLNRESQNKRSLILNLIDTLKIFEETSFYWDYFTSNVYFSRDEQKRLYDKRVLSWIISHYEKNYTEPEIRNLIEFYSTPIGQKSIDLEGLLRLQLFDSYIKGIAD